MRALLLSSLITLVGSTYAQTTDSEPPVKENSKDEVLALNTMVITGVAKPTEKIESSVAISTFSDTLMERLNPQSVTELVWSIPGFHPEDSGGEVGNNITPRGFPLTRQNDFVALQKDGMTVLYDQAVLFSTADRFTRVSNFIEQTEAIRGGTSSIYMGSSPAGYINFLSREGSQTAHGDVSIETNSASRAGFEGWVSGPLSERTTYALGGWYRADNSVRNPGFTANQGGEINGNIKHNFGKGNDYIKIDFNLQDDKAIFLLPMPLTGTTKDPKTIPGGMDIKDGTTGASARARFLHLANTPDGDINYDLQNGQAAKVSYFGTHVNYDLGDGWILNNQNRYTKLRTGFDAIINVGNARPLTGIANEIFNSAPARFAPAQSAGKLYFQIRDSGTGALLATQNTAGTLNTNGFGIDAGWFHRDFDATNFQNDLRLQKAIDNLPVGKLSGTIGVFFSNLDGQVVDHRFDTLQTIEPLPHRVDVVFTNPDGSAFAGNTGTYKGFVRGPSGFGNIIYSEKTIALYSDWEYKIGNFNFDLGGRGERLKADGAVENQGSYDLSKQYNDSGNPALTSLPFGDGSFRDFNLRYDQFAWTAAGDYKVNKDLGTFIRYSKGFRMPEVDNYQALAAFDPTTASGLQAINDFNRSKRPETEPTKTTMIEAGLKYRSRLFSASSNLFYAKAENLFFNVPTVVDGQIVQRQAFRNTEAPGIEAELSANPISGWNISFNGTYMQPKFFNTPPQSATDPATGQIITVVLNDKIPVRTPKIFWQLRSSYNFGATPIGSATVYASLSHTGRRFADDANTAELSPFSVLTIGASTETKGGFYLRADVHNALGSTGLTEGDPRAGETKFGGTPTFNARVVEPLLVTVKTGYRF